MIRCILPSVRAAFALSATICLLIAPSCAVHAQRLPDTVLPEHYTLALTPDLKTATFSGIESIDVSVKEPVNSITLNSAEIAFQSVIVNAGGKRAKERPSHSTRKRNKRPSPSLTSSLQERQFFRSLTPAF